MNEASLKTPGKVLLFDVGFDNLEKTPPVNYLGLKFWGLFVDAGLQGAEYNEFRNLNT